MAAIVQVMVGLFIVGVCVLGIVWLDRQRRNDYERDLAMMREHWEQQWRDWARVNAHPPNPPAEPPALADDLLREMVTRMLDASFPKDKVAGAVEAEQTPGSPPEYEPPFEPVGDWTDPFMGLERELVGGLRPGQGIPGITMPPDSSFNDHDPLSHEEQLAALDNHPAANGFIPDDATEWDHAQEMGDEAFAAWQAAQDEGRVE